MTIVLFIGIWLASYRLWKLLAQDVVLDGPRKGFFRRFPPDPATAALVHASKPHKFGVFIACSWCSGFWLSGLVVVVTAQCTSVSLPFLWWLATSSAVGLTAETSK